MSFIGSKRLRRTSNAAMLMCNTYKSENIPKSPNSMPDENDKNLHPILTQTPHHLIPHIPIYCSFIYEGVPLPGDGARFVNTSHGSDVLRRDVS